VIGRKICGVGSSIFYMTREHSDKKVQNVGMSVGMCEPICRVRRRYYFKIMIEEIFVESLTSCVRLAKAPSRMFSIEVPTY
jgi:hypothetical protein